MHPICTLFNLVTLGGWGGGFEFGCSCVKCMVAGGGTDPTSLKQSGGSPVVVAKEAVVVSHVASLLSGY